MNKKFWKRVLSRCVLYFCSQNSLDEGLRGRFNCSVFDAFTSLCYAFSSFCVLGVATARLLLLSSELRL